MYHIAICDDNKEFLDNIKEVIESNPEYEPNTMFYRFRSGEELLGSSVETYNLLILDMQMEQIDGFKTAVVVRRRNPDAVLAFCSGAVMPQPEHFEVQPYRYLLKKVDGEKMQKNISELLMEMKRRRKNHVIEITGDGKAYRVNVNDIVYVERLGRGSSFVVQQNEKDGTISHVEIQSNEKLVNWYQQLADDGFEFAHTSYIVNLQKITNVVKDDILMSNGQLLRISRTCKQKFHEKFSYYFSKKYRRDTDI